MDISSYVIQQMESEIKVFSANCQVGAIEKYYTITGNTKAYFIIMQCSPGWSTLEQILEVEKNMPLSGKVKLMKLIASAMLEISSCGSRYHHGHLHPANVLVDYV